MDYNMAVGEMQGLVASTEKRFRGNVFAEGAGS